jgi:hypothetical protein
MQMASLRNSIIDGDKKAKISVQEYANPYQLSPISLRTLIDPEIKVFDKINMYAGKVSGSFQIALTNNGVWAFRGSVFDSSYFDGDEYTVVASFDNIVDESGNRLSFLKRDKIGCSEKQTWEMEGINPLISKYWGNFLYHWKLHVDPKFPWNSIVFGLLIVVAAATGSKSRTLWGKDEDEASIRIRLTDPNENP